MLLSGALCASLRPRIATSPRQSGRLRFCVSLVHFCPCLFAGPVCVSPFPSACPCSCGTRWVSAGPSDPGPRASRSCPLCHCVPEPPVSSPGATSSSRGWGRTGLQRALSYCSAPSQPECQERGGALAVPLLEAAGAWEGSRGRGAARPSGAGRAPYSGGLHPLPLSPACRSPPLPHATPGTCLGPGGPFHRGFPQENQILMAPDSKDPEQPWAGWGGNPHPTGTDVEFASVPPSSPFSCPTPSFSPAVSFFYDCKHR